MSDFKEQLTTFINDLLYEKMSIDDYYNIMRKLGANRRGNRFNTICHNEDGGGYNLSFSEETRTFTCFSQCQCSFSLLTLIKKRRELLGEKSGTLNSLKWLCGELCVECNFKEEAKIINNIYNWKGLLRYTKNQNVVEFNTYDKSTLDYFPKIYHQDWLDYGISEEVLDKYNIRWYEYKQSIVIPCYNQDGDLIGIRVRNMNQDVDIKYIPLQMLNGKEFNFPTNEYFYGENFNWVNIARKKSAVLVESEKTVLKYETWYGAKNNICLALYGSNLSKSKLKKLLTLDVENVIIALDSDFTEIDYSENSEYMKFEKKVMKIYETLKPYMKNIYVIYNNLGFKDCYKFSITDYTKEQFEMLWESKERIET